MPSERSFSTERRIEGHRNSSGRRSVRTPQSFRIAKFQDDVKNQLKKLGAKKNNLKSLENIFSTVEIGLIDFKRFDRIGIDLRKSQFGFSNKARIRQ